MDTPENQPSTGEKLPPDVAALSEAVSHMSDDVRATLEPLLARLITTERRRKRILQVIQEVLLQLRLDMKYLTFDLEATRRERDELKKGKDGNERA